MELLRPLRQSAFELFCLGKKFLVFNLVNRNLKIKYRRSLFGVLWTMLTPLGMTVVYYFVFKVVLKVQIPYYLVFILSGMLPWNFFAQSIVESTESIVGNWGLVSKVPVPLQIFPYVGSITNLVTFGLSLPVLIAAAFFSGIAPGPQIVLLPIYAAALFLITYTLGLMLAVAFVFFRDLRHVIGIIMQLWFYATPVVYNESMIPEKYRWIIYANPVAPLFVGFHDIFVNHTWPSPQQLTVAMSWPLVMLMATAVIQRRYIRGLVEMI